MRANLLESTRFETILSARARGMTRFAILVRHGFRLAAVPMLTLAGFL
ncbi:MAG: nickel ABC transporter permease subunit NikB, partial [Actinobacteria bacterium]|nr:nickel ABC transporter permease subunit NikB [Actinomycetota bacterium]